MEEMNRLPREHVFVQSTPLELCNWDYSFEDQCAQYEAAYPGIKVVRTCPDDCPGLMEGGHLVRIKGTYNQVLKCIFEVWTYNDADSVDEAEKSAIMALAFGIEDMARWN